MGVMNNGNGNQPPMWLEATDPEELRVAMLRNNLKHSRRFHYFDISFAKGKWYCWFELSIDDKEVKELDGTQE